MSLEGVEEALAADAAEKRTWIVESELFDNRHQTKNLGNSQKISPGAEEPIIDFRGLDGSARGVIVQLQCEVLGDPSYSEAAFDTNIIATVIWGTAGGQQEAEISLGLGTTFCLAASFVRVSVVNPLIDGVLLVSGSAAPAAYAPNVGPLARLVYLQGVMPIIAAPWASPVVVDGTSRVFRLPKFARGLSIASMSSTSPALASSTRLVLTQLSNNDTTANILRVDRIPVVGYTAPETDPAALNVFQRDHIPLNPSCNGLRLDVDPSSARFSGLHKLTFELGL